MTGGRAGRVRRRLQPAAARLARRVRAAPSGWWDRMRGLVRRSEQPAFGGQEQPESALTERSDPIESVDRPADEPTGTPREQPADEPDQGYAVDDADGSHVVRVAGRGEEARPGPAEVPVVEVAEPLAADGPVETPAEVDLSLDEHAPEVPDDELDSVEERVAGRSAAAKTPDEPIPGAGNGSNDPAQEFDAMAEKWEVDTPGPLPVTAEDLWLPGAIVGADSDPEQAATERQPGDVGLPPERTEDLEAGEDTTVRESMSSSNPVDEWAQPHDADAEPEPAAEDDLALSVVEGQAEVAAEGDADPVVEVGVEVDASTDGPEAEPAAFVEFVPSATLWPQPAATPPLSLVRYADADADADARAEADTGGEMAAEADLGADDAREQGGESPEGGAYYSGVVTVDPRFAASGPNELGRPDASDDGSGYAVDGSEARIQRSSAPDGVPAADPRGVGESPADRLPVDEPAAPAPDPGPAGGHLPLEQGARADLFPVEGMPTMADLDRLGAQLDEIDAALARMDAPAPAGSISADVDG